MSYFALRCTLLATFILSTVGEPSCLEHYEASVLKKEVPLYRRAAHVHRGLHSEVRDAC